MITLFLRLLPIALTVLAVNKAAAFPERQTPLVMTVRQTMGMAPLTLRVKVKAAAEGREVCVIVDGPEYRKACRVLDGITWTQDFVLRVGGDYAVFAISENYRTPEMPIRVIGFGEGQ